MRQRSLYGEEANAPADEDDITRKALPAADTELCHVQNARVYEQVLREGNDDDVRRFIRADELIELWDDLVLPRHVRPAWADWLDRHRGVSVSC